MARAKSEKKRQQVLEAARTVFLARGFDGALMSDISTQAKCSKGTLYSYFPSKEELFFEVVIGKSNESEAIFAGLANRQNESIDEFLLAFGIRFLRTLYSPNFLAIRQLAFADNASPAARTIVYERGIKRYQKQLAELLKQSMSNGELKLAEPEIAAVQLCGLLESEFLLKYLFGVLGPVDNTELDAAAKRAVSTFISGYRLNR